MIPGYHTFVVDGKTYNATEHRILESRRDSRCPLPGRSIAVLDTRYELFVNVACEANAHRCERKNLTPLFESFQKGALYLLDRNFSDGETIQQFRKRRALFIIRQHGACPSWREIPGEKRTRCNCSSSVGGKVFEQKIEVALPDGTWIKLRRITIELKNPTRDGDRTLHFLTSFRGHDIHGVYPLAFDDRGGDQIKTLPETSTWAKEATPQAKVHRRKAHGNTKVLGCKKSDSLTGMDGDNCSTLTPIVLTP